MSAKNWKLLGYLNLVLFFILFVTLDGDAALFDAVWALLPVSLILFQKAKIARLSLDLIDGEVIESVVKQFLGAWVIWITTKRFVLCFPPLPKKGIKKFFSSIAMGDQKEEDPKQPYGYFLKKSTNIESYFNNESGMLSINLEDIDSVEIYEDKVGARKEKMRRIKLKDRKTEICLHLGRVGGGKKAFNVIDSLKKTT